jgi:hypothetical protein
MAKNKKETDAFAYDDAFRTMEGECDDILIPFVNYVFGERYTKRAVIQRMRNEHFIVKAGGAEEKRITDSHFEIIENGFGKQYHMECESKKYDNSILVRFLEYDTATAMDDIKWEGNKLIVRFPQSGLLLLRCSGKAPNEAQIAMKTPGGEVSYPVKIIKVSDFAVDDIFEKQLYLLIPYFIFNYEKEMRSIEEDEERINSLAKVYDNIVERMNEDQEKGLLSALSYGVIISMTKKVLRKLTVKHEIVHKKVGDSMGGKVLDLPEIRAYHQGKDEGRAEGKAEGLAMIALNMLRDGMDFSVVSKYTGIPTEKLKEIEKS